jgi:hypothetical protein
MRNFDYWCNIALATIFVIIAGFKDDPEGQMFLLFAATYLVIHAHGNRILSAINNRNDTPDV